MGSSSNEKTVKYRVYFRAGMYHFVLEDAMSDFAQRWLSDVTSMVFEGLSADDKSTASEVVQDAIREKIDEGVDSLIRERGLWFDEKTECWHARGENPWDDASPVNHEEGDFSWHTLLKKQLQRRYGGREGLFLANRISSLHRKVKDSCKDNERIALEGDVAEMERYEAQRDGGCCGFCDSKFKFTDRETGEMKVFWYGFNYGH